MHDLTIKTRGDGIGFDCHTQICRIMASLIVVGCGISVVDLSIACHFPFVRKYSRSSCFAKGKPSLFTCVDLAIMRSGGNAGV